jgi:hypothetical protein
LELWAQITDRSVGKGEHQKIRNLPLQKMDWALDQSQRSTRPWSICSLWTIEFFLE